MRYDRSDASSSDDRHGLQDTLDSALTMARATTAACDGVAVRLVRRGATPEVAAVAGPLARAVEEVQTESGEGPGLDVAGSHRLVVSPDLAVDPRWRVFGPRAVASAGARSVLCVGLADAERPVGSLDLFGRSSGGFSDDAQRRCALLAVHIGIAVSAARRADNLAVALSSRTLIGQATGVLMERYGIDAGHAFSTLQRISSVHNLKLRELAARVVAGDPLPGAPDRR